MTNSTIDEAKPAIGGHPKGLFLLYFTEMWERFSYYGMRAIFTLYMINALLFDKKMASEIYGSYTGLVYLTPLLGGYIADRYWGNRRSIIFGGFLMAIGQFLMFMSGSAYDNPSTGPLFMYGGLTFLIIGNGFFKPNISTMVGSLYTPGDRRVDSAFTIFYQGINMGALLAPIVCGTLGEQYDAAGAVIPTAFKWGFLSACIGMLISLTAFILLKNKYIHTPTGEPVGMPPTKVVAEAGSESKGLSMKAILTGVIALFGLFGLFYKVLDLDFIGSAIFSTCIVLPGLIIAEPSLTRQERDRILVIYIIAFFVIFFWSAFEQAGASLTFFAQEQTDRNLFGWNMPASLFQIFNAMFIVVLAPVAVAIWSALGKRNREPASPVKQAMGLGFLCLGYVFIAWGVKGVQPWDKVSMIWLVGLYLIHTIGELCLSPIGLSMVVKLAPARFVSLLMGVWFLSTATANKFAGSLSALYPEEITVESSHTTTANGAMTEIMKSTLDSTVWTLSAKENIALPTATLGMNDDSVTSLSLDPSTNQSVSVYHLKLLKGVNKDLKHVGATADGHYLVGYKKETAKTKEGEVTTEKLEVYNLKPEKPKFMGMEIKNLYDFFMIFVYLSGAAAILLFLIRKWLLSRMHGVR